jgi:hypothetical protein
MVPNGTGETENSRRPTGCSPAITFLVLLSAVIPLLAIGLFVLSARLLLDGLFEERRPEVEVAQTSPSYLGYRNMAQAMKPCDSYGPMPAVPDLYSRMRHRSHKEASACLAAPPHSQNKESCAKQRKHGRFRNRRAGGAGANIAGGSTHCV